MCRWMAVLAFANMFFVSLALSAVLLAMVEAPLVDLREDMSERPPCHEEEVSFSFFLASLPFRLANSLSIVGGGWWGLFTGGGGAVLRGNATLN